VSVSTRIAARAVPKPKSHSGVRLGASVSGVTGAKKTVTAAVRQIVAMTRSTVALRDMAKGYAVDPDTGRR